MQKISFSDIKPLVRFAKLLVLTPQYATVDVHACDFRIIYVFSGTLRVKMNDITYNAERGDFFLYPPTTKYSILNVSDSDAKIMSVNFDYLERENSPTLPIPKIHHKSWHPSDVAENLTFTDVPELAQPVFLGSMQKLEHTFSRMADEFAGTKKMKKEMLAIMISEVLLRVARRISDTAGQKTTDLVDLVIEYVTDNYTLDLSNHDIGKHFNYHPNYLNRIIQKRTGQSLHKYLLSYRAAKALELLQTSSLSVTEIAEKVGFSSVKHFSQTFKGIYGYSPIHFKD